jgi:predicted Ser/Thr protein kinase
VKESSPAAGGRHPASLKVTGLVEGSLVANRYKILAPLGKGGMGMVYKAHDQVLDEVVALKVLRPEVADSPEMGQRFLAEIKLARSVSHRNVCRIHEYGEDQGLRYISMAYIEGVDLKNVLRRRGPLPPREAYEIAIGVAEGLQAIHDEGIVHRDLKTPNLMLDGRGIVKLMDFGIAKQWAAETSAGMTAIGAIIGTPEYMSPEQVQGQRLDNRSDIYALGIVVYELFTGQTPFRSETPMGMLIKHIQEAPSFEGEVARNIPPALVPVLRKALAKDREERYSSASEFAAALRAAAGVVAVESGASVSPVPISRADTPVPGTTASLPTTFAEGTGQATIAAAPQRVPTAALVIGGLFAAGLIVVAIALVILLPFGKGVSTVPERPPVTSVGPVPRVPPSLAASPAVRGQAPDVVTEGTLVAPARPPVAISSPVPTRQVRPPVEPARGPNQPAVSVAHVNEELNAVLGEAEAAFAARQYALAAGFYEQALKADPGNERARVGRDLATRAAATEPAPRAASKAFSLGATTMAGQPARGSAPAGFEESSAVAVRPVGQAQASAGKIVIEVEPAEVRGGEPYTVRASLVNEGQATLRIQDVNVMTTVNGRTVGGSIPPANREVPPHQRMLVFSSSDHWKTETTSWSMAVLVRSVKGEIFRNELVWK